MTTTQSLEVVLKQMMVNQEFFRDLKLTETDKDTSAGIDLSTHLITINYNPNWAEKFMDRKLDHYLQKRNISLENTVHVLLRDLMNHEIGHRGRKQGCPEDYKTLSENFLKPIQQVLKTNNKDLLSYAVNIVTDIINNTMIKKFDQEGGETSLAGFYLFYHEQGKKNTGDKFSPLYEIFVRLNLYFNGEEPEKKLLDHNFSYDPKINTALKNFLDRTGVSSLNDEYFGDRKSRRDYLADRDHWENISRIFAEEILPLLDKPEVPPEKLPGSGGGSNTEGYSDSGSAPSSEDNSSSDGSGSSTGEDQDKNPNPKNNSSGPGKKQEDTKPNPSSGDEPGEDLADILNRELGDQFKGRDGFSQELNDKKNQKTLLRGRKAGSGPGWMTNSEYLIAYYELLASDKVFELTTPPVEGKNYPLIEIGERTFEFDSDDASEISGLTFNFEDRNFDLATNEFKYPVQAKVKDNLIDRPDIVFCLMDTSSSMLLNMPEGEPLGETVNSKTSQGNVWQLNSKYHVSLVAYFMIAQKLKDLGVYDSDAYFANFSYDTVLSRGLRNSLAEALHPQFGGTRIDLSKVEKLIQKKNTLIFSISDGEIENWPEISNQMITAGKYNPVFHVQIGDHSQYSHRLMKEGVMVKLVKSEKDLYDFVMDLTNKIYGGE
ncbi:MAG TPA: hypothetical protein VJC39_01395 [Candidatus Nanoarchaeia archaeon]|nr:hypothetical protein [Candidatus Nanoarchaeia archaeon]